MPITVVEGLQRGDEGKGRYVDMLAAEAEVVARYNGGPNAGHTVVLPDDTELDLHGIPSGVAHPHVVNVIGNGALVNAAKLPGEIDFLAEKNIHLTSDTLKISSGAHLILPHHISADEIREGGAAAQGTTKSGIAPTASEKAFRNNFRVEHIVHDPQALYGYIWEKLAEQRDARKALDLEVYNEEQVAEKYVEVAMRLGEFVTDTPRFLWDKLDRGETVIAEGAQAFLLDIDHGMYPNVTSSSPTAIGVPSGLGVPNASIDRIIGVAKVIQSHVGNGPFVTEISDPELLSRLHGDKSAVDAEVGTTTGRTRRLGYVDLPGIKRAVKTDGTTELALTKLDWVPRFGDDLMVCVGYEYDGKEDDIAPMGELALKQCTPIYEPVKNWTEDIQHLRSYSQLPRAAKRLIELIEDHVGLDVSMVGVGPRRDQVIQL